MTVIGVLFAATIFMFFNESGLGLGPKDDYAALPDLTVNTFINSIVNNSVNGSVQYRVDYTITYTNIGDFGSSAVIATSGFSMNCNNGGGFGGGGGGSLMPLNPGESTSYSSYALLNCNGLFTVLGSVDTTNVLLEHNENNNNASTSAVI